MRLSCSAFAAAVFLVACHPAVAQDAAPAAPNPTPPSPDANPPVIVPALTPIVVEILADESSATSKPGDTFPLRLAEPVVIGGIEIVPAGTAGVGEVIHAKKSGGSGAAGELILAADYLELDGRRLPLRSLKLSGAGKDAIGTVNGINVASAAAPVPGVAFVGFLIKGKQMVVAKGTKAAAKTAADFALPRAVAAPPAAENQTVKVSTAGEIG